jgi:predicted transcriptional regulator
MAEEEMAREHLLDLTADIVAAYLSNNSMSSGEIGKLIVNVHDALGKLGIPQETQETPEALTPAVSIRKSVTPDFLICLDDGKKFKSLKRHLTKLGMTPEQYRTKWNLPKEYPMVAANYAATRSSLAKAIGLGRKPEPVAPAPARGRRRTAVTG